MDVEIGEIVTTIRATDAQALVSPHVLRRIVEAVTAAVEAKGEHDKRVSKERRITGGVAQERDHDS